MLAIVSTVRAAAPLCCALMVTSVLAASWDQRPAGVRQAEPVRVGSLDRDRPEKTIDVPAIYPADGPKLPARGAAVALDITIDVNGKVIDARPVQASDSRRNRDPNAGASDLVMQIAVATVKQWQYAPPIVRGESVPVVTTVIVHVREEPRGARASRVGIARPWTYTDATMASTYSKSGEVESPLMKLKADLEAEGFRCVNTSRPDAFGSIKATHVATLRYLVHCAGDCRDVRYGLSVYMGRVRHLGAARGYPLVEVQTPLFAEPDIYWQFARATPGLPRITVYAFTNSSATYGGGCDFGR